MDISEIRASLDSVQNIEEEVQRLADAVDALEGLRDSSLVAPILGLFERCGTQDDFGMFSSLVSFLEHLSDDPASRLAVQASARRAPAWPTLQILPAFATAQETQSILQTILKEGSFRDPRYTRDWLETKLAEIQ